MARGGARPGAGRKAGKSANTSPLSRARARGGGSENQRPWPADKVERWAIDRLIPYAKNARTHTDAQIAAIQDALQQLIEAKTKGLTIKPRAVSTPTPVGFQAFGATHFRALIGRRLSHSAWRNRPGSATRGDFPGPPQGRSVIPVAEQWGRRWITIDTSRVALALARTRLMAARYPWYLLADSPLRRPSPGSRRCRAAGRRVSWRGPQSDRRPRRPEPASSSPTP
jgi:hypothetical protein